MSEHISEHIQAPPVGTALVEKAAAATRAAVEGLNKATEELKVAELAARQAAAAAQAPAGDLLTLAHAERDANDVLVMAQRVVAIAQQRLAAAQRAQHDAQGEEQGPIHDTGREIRLLACKRADAARAELLAAEAEFRRGTAMRLDARAKLCKATARMDGNLFDTPVQTAADEAKLWGN